MKRLEILDAVLGEEQIIRELAQTTWWQTYRNIISDDQIQYMLQTLYNLEVLRGLIASDNQRFIILREEGQPRAFAAYAARPDDPGTFKLHKLYVHPECQSKGFGRQLLKEITSRLQDLKIKALELNVNRENPARIFYEAYGFNIVRQEDIPIGPYWMNDYVMRLDITHLPIA